MGARRIFAREIIFGVHHKGRFAPDLPPLVLHTERLYTLNRIIGARARLVFPGRVLARALRVLAVVGEAELASLPAKAKAEPPTLDLAAVGIERFLVMQQGHKLQRDP